jgi:hypothetical protein
LASIFERTRCNAIWQSPQLLHLFIDLDYLLFILVLTVY